MPVVVITAINITYEHAEATEEETGSARGGGSRELGC